MTINDLQHLSQLDGRSDELSQTIGGVWKPEWNVDPGDLHFKEAPSRSIDVKRFLESLAHFRPDPNFVVDHVSRPVTKGI
jgi:hypothetical protein